MSNALTLPWFERQASRSLVCPLQVRSELKQFLGIVRNLEPQRLLEIGRCRGETLLQLARSCQKGATVVSLDMQPLGTLRTRFLRFFAPSRNIKLLTGDSHRRETLDLAGRTVAGTLDLLFIDGDHSYEGVKQDFIMYSPLVRPGGIIAFHDIAEHPPERQCEVPRFWNEVKLHYRHQEIIHDRNQGWAGIGVLYA